MHPFDNLYLLFHFSNTFVRHTDMSPEMIEGATYSQPLDIYSFGIILYEMVFGSNPFSKMNGASASKWLCESSLIISRMAFDPK